MNLSNRNNFPKLSKLYFSLQLNQGRFITTTKSQRLQPIELYYNGHCIKSGTCHISDCIKLVGPTRCLKQFKVRKALLEQWRFSIGEKFAKACLFTRKSNLRLCRNIVLGNIT